VERSSRCQADLHDMTKENACVKFKTVLRLWLEVGFMHDTKWLTFWQSITAILLLEVIAAELIWWVR
jgi:hypothetical protein